MFGRLLRLYTTTVAGLGAGLLVFGFWVVVLHSKEPVSPLPRAMLTVIFSCFLVACVAFTVLIWRRDAHGSRVQDLVFRPRPTERELAGPWFWTQVYAWALIVGVLSILGLVVLTKVP
jgi:cytochrome bd-type quinol oxidase subunit 2